MGAARHALGVAEHQDAGTLEGLLAVVAGDIEDGIVVRIGKPGTIPVKQTAVVAVQRRVVGP
jgi:hypothetical protein